MESYTMYDVLSDSWVIQFRSVITPRQSLPYELDSNITPLSYSSSPLSNSSAQSNSSENSANVIPTSSAKEFKDFYNPDREQKPTGLYYSGMSVEERDEKLKEVINYCRSQWEGISSLKEPSPCRTL